MASSVPKTFSRFWNPLTLRASTSKYTSFQAISKRWNSSSSRSSSTSQLALPGEDGWIGFLANAQKHRRNPPLSPDRVQKVQELRQMKKQLSEIQKMLSTLLVSNKSLTDEIRRLVTKLDTHLSSK